MFAVVEGIEGSGKSTLIAGLIQRLRAEGYDVLATREPGGTAAGDAIRRVFLDRSVAVAPLAEAFLVNAARAQHIEEVIRPALASGRVVLCDRFVDSTLAYQGYGRGLDLGVLRRMCDLAVGDVRSSLVVVLDLPWQTARVRLRERGGAADRLESEDDAFHERVRAGFLELAREPQHVVLDALLTAEELLERAWTALRSRMNAPVS
ncbi:MAG: dTMP kinase [Candidatus Eremiobacteraeota bacterium]|nr:dTMP kinase [Candidatus Eremiobacteraeota bacterium]